MGWQPRLAIVLASLLCAACGPASFEPRLAGNTDLSVGDPAELLRASREHFRLGNVALALQGFRRLARQEPANVRAHVGMAACYDRMGRFDLSRRYYEEAMALAPSDRNVRYNFAVSLRLQGLHAEARRAESEAAETVLADPALAGGSVTIDLPPVETAAREPAGPKEGAELVRLSFGEVALITVDAEAPARLREVAAAANPGITLALAPAPPARPAEPSKTAAKPALQAGELRILNGVGRRGLASRVRLWLDRQGVAGTSVGDASIRAPRSIIAYPEGDRARAAALASRLPFRAELRVKPAGRMVLLLGRDALALDDGLRRGTRSS